MFLPEIAHARTFMPVQGTKTAEHVDFLYSFLLWTSLIFFILLIGGMIYFVVKYRRKSINDKTPYITHDIRLEFLWSFIPFVLFMVAAAWGIYIYFGEMRTMPENALEINVVAKKWEWKFIYKNGREITDTYDDKNERVHATAVVPVGRPVKLVMTSQEAMGSNGRPTTTAVLHSFFIPAFRIKQDVIPGRYSAETFTAEKEGLFQVFCTEYCGSQHSKMAAHIKVVSVPEYEAWLSGEGVSAAAATAGGGETPAQLGKKVYQQNACVTCHSVDGSRLVGPSFKGLWGRSEVLEDGTVVVDENYIRQSILEPGARVVKGYPNGQMPVFKGVLSDEQISQVIEFIKTLK